MINLRYHVVSITAVFLALAVGVVMGTSFLGKATVDQLKTQISKAESRSDATQRVNSKLTSEIKRLAERDDSMRQQAPQLLAQHLTGEPVLIIASAGVDRESLAALETSLEATAANFKGTLVVNSKLRLEGDDLAKMADLVGVSSTNPTRIRRVLTARVATMLANSGEPLVAGEGSTTTSSSATSSTTSTTTSTGTTVRRPTPTSSTTTTAPPDRSQPQLLTQLRDGGWLSYQPPAGGSSDDLLLTATGYRYVVVSGSGAAVPDELFLRPVLTDFATQPSPVVVASAAVGSDPEATRMITVGPIRQNDQLKKNVSTVDDLESFNGDAAVVLALEDLNDVHGHYGVGDGASSLLPLP